MAPLMPLRLARACIATYLCLDYVAFVSSFDHSSLDSVRNLFYHIVSGIVAVLVTRCGCRRLRV